MKPGTDFKVPPPPVTSEAIGTGGRSSFRCVMSDGASDGGARARGGPSDGVAGIGLGANARATDEDSNENARLMTSSLD